MRYRIGEYFELYQGLPTPHRTELISAENIEEAHKISEKTYGRGAWVQPLICVYCRKNQCNKKDDACDYCIKMSTLKGCDVSDLWVGDNGY